MNTAERVVETPAAISSLARSSRTHIRAAAREGAGAASGHGSAGLGERVAGGKGGTRREEGGGVGGASRVRLGRPELGLDGIRVRGQRGVVGLTRQSYQGAALAPTCTGDADFNVQCIDFLPPHARFGLARYIDARKGNRDNPPFGQDAAGV